MLSLRFLQAAVAISWIRWVFGGLQSGAPWPMVGHDARHSGVSQHNTSMTAPLCLWRYEIGTEVPAPSVVGADGTVYVSSAEGTSSKMYALNGRTGQQIWSFPATEGVYAAAAISDDNTVYVPSANGFLHAVDGSTGIEKWSVETGGASSRSPTIGLDSTIYVRGASTVFAINPDGAVKWQQQCSYCASVAISTSGAIIVGCNTYVAALHANDGHQLWSFNVSVRSWYGAAVSEDGLIVVGSDDEKIYALNETDGALIWSFGTDDAVTQMAAIKSDDRVYVGGLDQRLYALGEGNGREKWHYRMGGQVESSPAIGAEGTLFIGNDDGYLYAFDTLKQKLRWKYATGDAIRSSPAIGEDGMVYVSSNDGFVYAFGPSPCVIGEEAIEVSIGTPSTFDCLPCERGSASPYGYACEICKGGTYASQNMSAECQKCPEGKYSSSGAYECKDCPGFSYSEKGSSHCPMVFLDVGIWLYFVVSFLGVTSLAVGYLGSGGGFEYLLTILPSVLDLASDVLYLATTVFAAKSLFVATAVFLTLSSLHFLGQVAVKALRSNEFENLVACPFVPFAAMMELWEDKLSRPFNESKFLVFPCAIMAKLFEKLFCFEDVNSLAKAVVALIIWLFAIPIGIIAGAVAAAVYIPVLLIWLVVTIAFAVAGFGLAMVFLACWLAIGLVLYHFKMLALPAVANTWSCAVFTEPWAPEGRYDVKVSNSDFNSMLFVEILFEATPQLIIQGVNNTMLGYWSPIAYISTGASIVSALNTLYRLGYWSICKGATFSDIPPIGNPTVFNDDKHSNTRSTDYTRVGSMFCCVNKAAVMLLIFFIYDEVDQIFDDFKLSTDYIFAVRLIAGLMWFVTLFTAVSDATLPVAIIDSFKAIFFYLCALALTRIERVLKPVRGCHDHDQFPQDSYLMYPEAGGTVFASLLVVGSMLFYVVAEVLPEGRQGESALRPFTTFIIMVMIYTLTYAIITTETRVYRDFNEELYDGLDVSADCEKMTDTIDKALGPTRVMHNCILGLFAMESLEMLLNMKAVMFGNECLK